MLKRWITKGTVLLGVMLPPLAIAPAEVQREAYDEDRRAKLQRIKSFFLSRKCPVHKYAADFVAAAEKNRLDWRLLPSIALVESSGGKAYTNNNIFGWDSCKQRFPTVRAGIHTVAERLGNSPLYKDKTVDEKLKTYNSRPVYAKTVKRVMAQLATEPVSEPIGM